MIEWNYSVEQAPFDTPLLVAVNLLGEIEYAVLERYRWSSASEQTVWSDQDGRRFKDAFIRAWANIDPPAKK